jgi:phage-related baseplate assembly protein
METKKDISYIGKDFGQFKKNLIDFTKQYFPNTYTDFNDASPGMLFVELSSYVGDVLSFYADSNLRESFLDQAVETANIYDLAKALGYKPKTAAPAYVTLDVFQVVPAIGSGANVVPDYNYALSIQPGMRVKPAYGNSSIFRTLDSINFAYSSSYDTTDVTIYDVDPSTKTPTYFLLKKKAKAVSGEVKTQSFTFGSPLPYDKILLNDTNIIEIISVDETDGDNWYEVPYLAQDTIFESVPNLAENDPTLSQYRADAPSLLKMKKTAKRFITRLRSDNRLEIQFGAGISDNNDEELVPNPTNVGNGLSQVRKEVNVDLDPSNFLYTRTYGQAPSNTTLTVTYTIGNGITDNVPNGVITDIKFVQYDEDVNTTATAATVNFIKTTIAANNSIPATGGKTADSLQDIKNNALANFATQNRLVTREDYIIRAYSMPAKFGSVAKAYIVPDDQISQQSFQQARIPNPYALNLYVLGYNSSKQLTELNQAVKENLKTYLDYYRILTDAVNIKDAFIINFGLDFEISVLSNYNSNEVLLKCVDALKTYFDIDRWQINQPIIKTDAVTTIANVKGVQSVISVNFKNLYKTTDGYSGNTYDLKGATKSGIIYPSLDPSIFEIKFPNSDIRGRVVNY